MNEIELLSSVYERIIRIIDERGMGREHHD